MFILENTSFLLHYQRAGTSSCMPLSAKFSVVQCYECMPNGFPKTACVVIYVVCGLRGYISFKASVFIFLLLLNAL